MVYLKARARQTNLRFKPLYALFYYILRRSSNLRVDEKAHDTSNKRPDDPSLIDLKTMETMD